ncbi:MAG: HopJ type III effector protein [Brachymonas sp.]|jgi:hypothetical protein
MKTTTQDLLSALAQERADFAAVLAHIDAHYDFTPTAFDNGQAPHAAHNAAGQNSGSCKVFSFAQVEGLDATQTLALFAEHYRAVLATPQAQDHANIRNFMQHGFAGLRFAGVALVAKTAQA